MNKQKLAKSVDNIDNNQIKCEPEEKCDVDKLCEDAQKKVKERSQSRPYVKRGENETREQAEERRTRDRRNRHYYVKRRENETREQAEERRARDRRNLQSFLERRKERETDEEAKLRRAERAQYMAAYHKKKKEQKQQRMGEIKKVKENQELVKGPVKLEINREENYPPRVYMPRIRTYVKKMNERIQSEPATAGGPPANRTRLSTEEQEIINGNQTEPLMPSESFDKNSIDMIRKRYIWCAVPQCSSSTRRNPNKMFTLVPFKSRTKWFQLARMDSNHFSFKSRIYFCEDHFNMPNDVANYMEMTIMISVGRFATKKNCLPSKFECQKNKPEPPSIKRQKLVEALEAESSDKVETSVDDSDSDYGDDVIQTMKVEEESEIWMDVNSPSYESGSSKALVSPTVSTSGNNSFTNLNIKREPPETALPYDDSLASSSTNFHNQGTDEVPIQIKTEPSSPSQESPIPFEFVEVSESSAIKQEPANEIKSQFSSVPASPFISMSVNESSPSREDHFHFHDIKKEK